MNTRQRNWQTWRVFVIWAFTTLTRNPKLRTVIWCGLTLLLSPMGANAASASKLRLMYLVMANADDLKPGSTVAVGPAFFTDGKRVVFAYDYCDARWAKPGRTALTIFEKANLLSQGQVADDLTPINAWCADVAMRNERGSDFEGAPVSVKADRLVGVDHEGYVVQLRSIELNGSRQLGKGVIGTVSGPEVASPPLTDRMYRFFLMGSDRALLKRMVPAWKVDPEKVRALVQKLDSVKQESKGTVQGMCRPRRTLEWCERGRTTQYENAPIQGASGFVADIDHDGDLELVAGLRATIPDRKNLILAWHGMVIIKRGGDAWVRGNAQYVANPEPARIDRYSNFLFLPLLINRVGGCTYLVSFTSSMLETLSLISLPDAMKECPHRMTSKLEQGE